MKVVGNLLALALLGTSGLDTSALEHFVCDGAPTCDVSRKTIGYDVIIAAGLNPWSGLANTVPTAIEATQGPENASTSAQNAPAVNLTVEERRRLCKMFAAVIGKNPKRCNTDPDKYYEELVAEQQRRADAAEARKKKAEEARKAQLEADKRHKAEQLAKEAEAAKKAGEARKVQEAKLKDAENAKRILEAEKAAEDARRMAIEASRKADQLKEGQVTRAAYPAPSDMLRQKDLQKRGDHGNFSLIGLAGMGTYYGFGASGRWNPPFLDERISLKMGIGGVQISNSALSVRNMNSINRLYWSPAVAFNILKRDGGYSLDLGPSYTWIGKFAPHMNTIRGFGVDAGFGYKQFSLGLGVGNNSVTKGYTGSGWSLHGEVGWRFFGF